MEKLATYPSLRGKTVLISGGAAGIGASTVELFCRQGSNVVFLDIADSTGKELCTRLQNEAVGTQPVFLHCDVQNLDQLKACADKTLSKFGKIDVLVNNAGLAGPGSRVPTSGVTAESFEFDVNVNLRHQFFLTQAVVPSMQRQRSGSIINLGSISWRIPATGVPVYTTLKAGIMGMTRTHAREFGEYNIRVNSVMPGSIATERQIRDVLTAEYKTESLKAQSLKRVIMPVEVASLVLFLASDDSSGITGGSHLVDGGWCGDS